VIFLDLCKANRLAENTLMNYEVHLRLYLLPVLARRRLDEVKPTDLTAIKASLASKARGTMTEVLKTLRRVFSVAIEQKILTRSRCSSTSRRGSTSSRSPTARTTARRCSPLPRCSARLRRHGAARHRRRSATRGDPRAAVVGPQPRAREHDGPAQHRARQARRAEGPHRGGGRPDPRLAEALAAIKHQRGPFVFSTDAGGHYKEHDIERWMHHLVTEARLAWHGTHVLRKTCGTRIADGGGGVAAVASHLRHKSLQTASRYIDRTGASTRAIHALES
jgi:site-specific recombinase XerD